MNYNFVQNLSHEFWTIGRVTNDLEKDISSVTEPPRATFFVWAPVPDGSDSRKWAARLLQEAGVVVTPGVGFGPSGEGYYRIALTVDKARIAEAMERLGRLSLS